VLRFLLALPCKEQAKQKTAIIRICFILPNFFLYRSVENFLSFNEEDPPEQAQNLFNGSSLMLRKAPASPGLLLFEPHRTCRPALALLGRGLLRRVPLGCAFFN